MADIRKFEVQHFNGTFARRPSNYRDARVLAANTAEVITVPTDSTTGLKAQYVVFSATADFYVQTDGTTAAVPAADITNGTSPELNPTVYLLGSAVTEIDIISPEACIVTLSFYM